MNINQALQSLNPANDDHWTSDGLPRVDVVAERFGVPVTRKQITDAAPDLVRGQPDHENVEAETPETVTVDGVMTFTNPELVEAVKAGQLETDWDAGVVVPEDDVVGMPPQQVYGSIELIDRAQTEFGRQAVVLAQRKDDVDRGLKTLGKRSELLSRARNNLTRGTQQDEHRKTMQDHQRGQQRIREERAKKLQKFIEAGVTPQQVAAELSGPSKLDAALKKRARPAGISTWPSAMNK